LSKKQGIAHNSNIRLRNIADPLLPLFPKTEQGGGIVGGIFVLRVIPPDGSSLCSPG
jgi:hypothetical protein